MGGDERSLVEAVFDSNWVAPTGPMVDQFEASLARLTGIDHVAALSSGTAALHLALRLCEIGPGDEVWCPTMTFIGGVAPICYTGASPVFLDIDPDTLLLDLDLLAEALEQADKRSGLPKVVITTDLYGHVVDTNRMLALKARYGFIWISDAAEAVGSTLANVHAGKGADFAILSFNGNKIITTSGGGALASDDRELIARARFLSTQARDPAPYYQHSTYGYNYRLSNVCAAIGVGQLRVLQDRVDQRRAIFDGYRRRLNGIAGLRFTTESNAMRSNRWLTTILIDPDIAGFTREDLRLAMAADEIESRPLWKPMHLQPVFNRAQYTGSGIAERAFDLGLCLPSATTMTTDDIDLVCSYVNRLYRG
jgi:pyridoxal phosphate-dependent aminotransferase EpsN